MDESRRVIRLDIDGYWTAEDMAVSFSSLTDLYRMRLVLQVLSEESRDLDHLLFEFLEMGRLHSWRRRRLLPFLMLQGFGPMVGMPPLSSAELGRVVEYVYPDRPLQVRRIEYGSPGHKDLAGVGEVIGHLKDFTLRIIELVMTRHRRRLEDERLQVEIQRMRIENAREFLRVASENNYSPSELRQLINWVDDRQEPLIRLADEGKIRQVRILEEPENEQRSSQ